MKCSLSNFPVGIMNINREGRTVANESKQNAASLAGALGPDSPRSYRHWSWFQVVTDVEEDVLSEALTVCDLLGLSYAAFFLRYVDGTSHQSESFRSFRCCGAARIKGRTLKVVGF